MSIVWISLIAAKLNLIVALFASASPICPLSFQLPPQSSSWSSWSSQSHIRNSFLASDLQSRGAGVMAKQVIQSGAEAQSVNWRRCFGWWQSRELNTKRIGQAEVDATALAAHMQRAEKRHQICNASLTFVCTTSFQ